VTFTSFGIVGYGHFGAFLAQSLASHGDVVVVDEEPPSLRSDDVVRAGTLDDVARCDVAVLAVPYAALADVLEELRPRLAPETVVMDVVSTKAAATQLLRRLLPDHPELIASHPLFGPPSMSRIEPGDRLVVTYRRGDRAEAFTSLLASAFGLELIEVAPEDHDRAMAYMQALPFFIARALVRIDIPEVDQEDLWIPSFEKLATIAEIEQHHTPSMFDTSQRSNPYARAVRQAFLDALAHLQQELDAADADQPLLAPD